MLKDFLVQIYFLVLVLYYISLFLCLNYFNGAPGIILIPILLGILNLLISIRISKIFKIFVFKSIKAITTSKVIVEFIILYPKAMKRYSNSSEDYKLELYLGQHINSYIVCFSIFNILRSLVSEHWKSYFDPTNKLNYYSDVLKLEALFQKILNNKKLFGIDCIIKNIRSYGNYDSGFLFCILCNNPLLNQVAFNHMARLNRNENNEWDNETVEIKDNSANLVPIGAISTGLNEFDEKAIKVNTPEIFNNAPMLQGTLGEVREIQGFDNKINKYKKKDCDESSNDPLPKGATKCKTQSIDVLEEANAQINHTNSESPGILNNTNPHECLEKIKTDILSPDSSKDEKNQNSRKTAQNSEHPLSSNVIKYTDDTGNEFKLEDDWTDKILEIDQNLLFRKENIPKNSIHCNYPESFVSSLEDCSLLQIDSFNAVVNHDSLQSHFDEKTTQEILNALTFTMGNELCFQEFHDCMRQVNIERKNLINFLDSNEHIQKIISLSLHSIFLLFGCVVFIHLFVDNFLCKSVFLPGLLFTVPWFWNLFDSFLFIVFRKPYDIGDRVFIGDDNLIVKSFGLTCTVFERWNNEIVIYTNYSLRDTIFKNIRRSRNQTITLKSYIRIKDIGLLDELNSSLKAFVASTPGLEDIIVSHEKLIDGNYTEVNVRIKHSINHQNGYFMWVAQNKFMKEFVRQMKLYGIAHYPMDVPVHIEKHFIVE